MFSLNLRNKCSLLQSDKAGLPNDIIAMIFGYIGVSVPEEAKYLMSLDSKGKYLRQAIGNEARDLGYYLKIFNIEDANERAEEISYSDYNMLLSMYLNDTIKLNLDNLSTLFSDTLHREDYYMARKLISQYPDIIRIDDMLWNAVLIFARNLKEKDTSEYSKKLQRISLFFINNFMLNDEHDVETYGRHLADIMKYGWYDVAEAIIRKSRVILNNPFYAGAIIGEHRKDVPDLFKELVVNNLEVLNKSDIDNEETEDASDFLDSFIMSANDLQEEQEIKELLISLGVSPNVIDFSYRT